MLLGAFPTTEMIHVRMVLISCVENVTETEDLLMTVLILIVLYFAVYDRSLPLDSLLDIFCIIYLYSCEFGNYGLF